MKTERFILFICVETLSLYALGVLCQYPFLNNYPRSTVILQRPRTQPQRVPAMSPRWPQVQFARPQAQPWRHVSTQPVRFVAAAAAPHQQQVYAPQRPAALPQQRPPTVRQQQRPNIFTGPGYRGGFGEAADYSFGGFQSGYGLKSSGADGYGGGGQWYNPHRPHPGFYRNFASVYRDLDLRFDNTEYNEALEMEEVHDDFNGRSIVAPGQYPHMAALGYLTVTEDIEFRCGGSLISEVFVLTAAHCCYSNRQAPEIVRIAAINLQVDFDNTPQMRRVAQIQVHPYYNSSFYYHDIALILLDHPVIYTRFVRPIRLWVSDKIPYGKVYTMGYGSTSFGQAPTNILTELDMSIVPLPQCNQSFPQDPNVPYGLLETQICAKDFEQNRDTCQGDSGGPLQLNLLRRRRRHRFRYYLVGITSYGRICRSPYPGVYTRVSSYID